MKDEKLERAIALYLKGESIGRAVGISECNLWDLLDELREKGITRGFDLEVRRDILVKNFAKDDPTFEKRIEQILKRAEEYRETPYNENESFANPDDEDIYS